MLPPPGTPVVPLYTGKYLRLVAQGTWEYADRSRSTGAVNIVAITPDESLIVVEQYRVPLQRPAIELPAGLVGDTPVKRTKPNSWPHSVNCSKRLATPRRLGNG